MRFVPVRFDKLRAQHTVRIRLLHERRWLETVLVVNAVRGPALLDLLREQAGKVAAGVVVVATFTGFGQILAKRTLMDVTLFATSDVELASAQRRAAHRASRRRSGLAPPWELSRSAQLGELDGVDGAAMGPPPPGAPLPGYPPPPSWWFLREGPNHTKWAFAPMCWRCIAWSPPVTSCLPNVL